MHGSRAQFSKSSMHRSFLSLTVICFLALCTADVMSLTVIYYKYLDLHVVRLSLSAYK